MDKKPAVGHRIHFRKIFTSTPLLLVDHGARETVVFVNEGSGAVRLGFSGSVATSGVYLGGGLALTDNYSQDEYWGYVSSGSGTVSGFMVI